MNSFNYTTNDMSGLAAVLERLIDAGVDPAFDSDLEELERQFAECRFAICD